MRMSLLTYTINYQIMLKKTKRSKLIDQTTRVALARERQKQGKEPLKRVEKEEARLLRLVKQLF